MQDSGLGGLPMETRSLHSNKRKGSCLSKQDKLVYLKSFIIWRSHQSTLHAQSKYFRVERVTCELNSRRFQCFVRMKLENQHHRLFRYKMRQHSKQATPFCQLFFTFYVKVLNCYNTFPSSRPPHPIHKVELGLDSIRWSSVTLHLRHAFTPSSARLQAPCASETSYSVSGGIINIV